MSALWPRADFAHTNDPEPHRVRTKAILGRHPEIRHLIGRNPGTFVLMLIVVAAQLGCAVALRQAPWWLLLGVAYGIGAFLDHALFVMLHE